MCCKLWNHYSGVIPPLMQSVELVQCIECGGDDYFLWMFPFFFACMSLPSSSVFYFLVQVACLTPPEECSLLGLTLNWSASSSLILGFSFTCWFRTNVGMSSSTSLYWAYRLYSILGSYPSHSVNMKMKFFLKKRRIKMKIVNPFPQDLS